MDEEEITTEQLILKAAEKVFIEKGFAATKMMEIAKEAGVNHAMIHYYFRTKESLFNTVYAGKVEILANSFSISFNQNIPFFEKLKAAIETHFDFVAANPKLMFFLYGEMVNDKKKKMMLIKTVLPKVEAVLNILKEGIDSEVEKGNIRRIKPIELLMNIIALNIIVFLTLPLLETLVENPEKIKEIIDERKKQNIEFIIKGLSI